MSTMQRVPSVLGAPALPVSANSALPTEHQLIEAYRQLMLANSEHTKRGLEFGRMCYQVQQDYKAQGRAGEGFKARLAELGIVERTAYRWIRKYKQRELRATWHEVKTKRKKKEATSDGQNIAFEFDLPANYRRKQWEEDVKLLGRKKVRELFVEEFLPEVHKRAEAKRSVKPPSRSVH